MLVACWRFLLDAGGFALDQLLALDMSPSGVEDSGHVPLMETGARGYLLAIFAVMLMVSPSGIEDSGTKSIQLAPPCSKWLNGAEVEHRK